MTRPRRILLAEDCAAHLEILKKFVERKGHAVECVRNGREALKALERERFDAVLMDVRMPEMDGVEALRHIREGANAPDIPVIAVTACAMEEERTRLLEGGMTGYLPKRGLL